MRQTDYKNSLVLSPSLKLSVMFLLLVSSCAAHNTRALYSLAGGWLSLTRSDGTHGEGWEVVFTGDADMGGYPMGLSPIPGREEDLFSGFLQLDSVQLVKMRSWRISHLLGYRCNPYGPILGAGWAVHFDDYESGEEAWGTGLIISLGYGCIGKWYYAAAMATAYLSAGQDTDSHFELLLWGDARLTVGIRW